MGIFDGTGYTGGNQPISNTNQIPGFDAQQYYAMGNYGNPAQTGTGGFDWGMNPQSFQAIGQGLGAFQSLASIYGMFQNLGLQKKAFKFAQEGTKRNFNAQATAFNEESASQETARRAYASANNQDYNSMYAYGTGQKIDKWI